MLNRLVPPVFILPIRSDYRISSNNPLPRLHYGVYLPPVLSTVRPGAPAPPKMIMSVPLQTASTKRNFTAGTTMNHSNSALTITASMAHRTVVLLNDWTSMKEYVESRSHKD